MDIIISSEYYKKKLIFTNTKNQRNGEIYKNVLAELKERAATREEQVPFDYIQVRTKFKKVISECKSVALTVKTASGIARFVDEKNYGKWFNDLYAIVKTRDACRPELAVEPSCSELSSMIDEDSEECSTNEASTSTSSNKERLVINKRSRKKKKQDVINEALNVIKSAIEKDPTKEVLSYLRDESEQAREHELKVMQMLTQSSSTFQPQQMYNMQPKYPEYTCEGGSQAWQHTQMLQPPNQNNGWPYGFSNPPFG